jgi:hypothetical protein
MILTGKPNNTEKPIPVLLSPSEIPHGLPWVQTQASAMRSGWQCLRKGTSPSLTTQFVKILPCSMEPKVSLPHPQNPNIGPYPKTTKSSPHPVSPWCILIPFHLCLDFPSGLSSFSDKLCMHILSPLCIILHGQYLLLMGIIPFNHFPLCFWIEVIVILNFNYPDDFTLFF